MPPMCMLCDPFFFSIQEISLFGLCATPPYFASDASGSPHRVVALPRVVCTRQMLLLHDQRLLWGHAARHLQRSYANGQMGLSGAANLRLREISGRVVMGQANVQSPLLLAACS